jgi:hypothetical protein
MEKNAKRRVSLYSQYLGILPVAFVVLKRENSLDVSQFCLQKMWTYVSLHIVGLLNDTPVSIPGRSGDISLLRRLHAALRPN